jgi:polyhydroxyalkanoate synthesis regulator phasin
MTDAKLIEEIMVYLELSNDEVSSYCEALIDILENHDGEASEKLLDAIREELKDHLMLVKTQFRIVEETITPAPYTVKRLEWIG